MEIGFESISFLWLRFSDSMCADVELGAARQYLYSSFIADLSLLTHLLFESVWENIMSESSFIVTEKANGSKIRLDLAKIREGDFVFNWLKCCTTKQWASTL
jgi:hypothetical protein